VETDFVHTSLAIPSHTCCHMFVFMLRSAYLHRWLFIAY